MANGQIPGQDEDAAPPGGAPMGGGGGPGGGGPPAPGGGGAGGILAALQRSRNQPQPTAPGPGDQGDALMKVKQAMEMLHAALPALSGTPIYVQITKFLGHADKAVPQGAPAAGVQQTFHKDIGRQMAKNWLMQQVAQNQGGAGGQQGAGAMPSTPLPGA